MRSHGVSLVTRMVLFIHVSFLSQIDPKVAFPRRAQPKVSFLSITCLIILLMLCDSIHVLCSVNVVVCTIEH